MNSHNPAIFDAVIAHLNAACLPEPGGTFLVCETACRACDPNECDYIGCC